MSPPFVCATSQPNPPPVGADRADLRIEHPAAVIGAAGRLDPVTAAPEIMGKRGDLHSQIMRMPRLGICY